MFLVGVPGIATWNIPTGTVPVFLVMRYIDVFFFFSFNFCGACLI